jgi:cellulose synthase/poly-beta-1,6-N-acetylglucosamine synthase-like glycosyltransferase
MNENSTPNDISDRIEQRWERRQERRKLRNGGGEWILGVILILLGGFIYLQTMKIYTLNNWWALFILIPGLAALVEAWRVYRAAEGKFTRRARGSLILGVGLLLVTTIFLLGLNWTIFGPILLVLAGASMIINGMIPD